MIRSLKNEGNDEIRENILRYLYEIHRNTRSPRLAGKGIRDLQKELKKRFGYKQQDVARNLDYLTQQDWAREDVTSRVYQTASGTLQSAEKVTCKITHIGIDRLESPSAFRRSDTENMNV